LTSGLRLKMRKAPNTDSVGTAFTLANTAARAEQQLADQIIDPETGVPYVNEAAGPDGDGLATNLVINFEQAGNAVAYFPADTPFPHIDPAFIPDPNNIAVEVTAYVELAAGIHRLGVRSDDGFRLTCGPTFENSPLVLGVYEGGRGDGLPGGATEFEFQVQAGGVYPLRLIYYEGNGGSSLEFYSVDRTTFRRTLINEPTPGALKAFVSRSTVVYLPEVTIVAPVNQQVFPNFPTNLTLTATASEVNGQIAKVEFFVASTQKLGEATAPPYTVVWSNVSAGRYLLTARATDAKGLSTTSAAIRVQVGASLIANVVETGGMDEPTDTVSAKWTDVTFSNGVVGEFLDPYTVPPFGEDAPAYVDRAHQWNGITAALPLPGYLVGGEYVMSGNDNRGNTPYQLEITLNEECNVYVLVDNRLGDASNDNPPNYPDWQLDRTGDGLPDMAWLLQQGWAPVKNGLNRTNNPDWPDEVGVDEAGDGVGPGNNIQNGSSVYVKRVPAGVVTILDPDNPGQNMYGVVVTRVPATPSQPPVFAPPTLSGGTVTITWTNGGKLQEAAEIRGPWDDVPGNPNGTYSTPATALSRFYRAVAP
jgi:hypothetical protein